MKQRIFIARDKRRNLMRRKLFQWPCLPLDRFMNLLVEWHTNVCLGNDDGQFAVQCSMAWVRHTTNTPKCATAFRRRFGGAQSGKAIIALPNCALTPPKAWRHIALRFSKAGKS